MPRGLRAIILLAWLDFLGKEEESDIEDAENGSILDQRLVE